MSYDNLKDISYVVYILITVFAVSSWVDLVGVRVEVPLMINVLPEGWKLLSYIVLTSQSANVGPLLYSIISTVLAKRNKNKIISSHSITDIVLSFVIISIEIASLFLLSFFWNYTTTVNGKEHSIAILTLLGITGLCSCLSSLVYLPYMARYPPYYFSAYYLGYGLCSFIPGMIGLFQDVGEEPTCVNVTIFENENCLSGNCSNVSSQYKLVPHYNPPRFSVQVFFLIICGLLFMSMAAFYCLNYTKLRRHQVHLRNNLNSNNVKECDSPNGLSKTNEVYKITPISGSKIFSRNKLNYFLITLGLEYFLLFGFLPPILPFACLPYGNKVFNVTIRLSSVCIGLVSIVILFVPHPSEKTVTSIFFIGLPPYIYLVVLALQSPYPILQHETIGSILVIFSSMVTHTCLGFYRVIVTMMLHTYGGRKAMMWCGRAMQAGSFTGGMVSFVLINWTEMFVSSAPCQ